MSRLFALANSSFFCIAKSPELNDYWFLPQASQLGNESGHDTWRWSVSGTWRRNPWRRFCEVAIARATGQVLLRFYYYSYVRRKIQTRNEHQGKNYKVTRTVCHLIGSKLKARPLWCAPPPAYIHMSQSVSCQFLAPERVQPFILASY